LNSWWIFIQERFSPLAYLPMILLFAIVNAMYAVVYTGTPWLWGKFLVTLLIVLSFFFRMRLFDEIKDLQTDLNLNPHRPLPRGLLQIKQVKKMIVHLIVFEVIFSFLVLGIYAGLQILFAITYSLLMYREFFIGDFLRPKLTAYAVSHTFVVMLLALFIWVGMLNQWTPVLNSETGIFLIMNWCFFNLFEFARKSFAANEERPLVASYTHNFGIFGAVFLSNSQVILGGYLGLLAVFPLHIFNYVFYRNIIFVGVGIYFFGSTFFVLFKSKIAAQIFRVLSGIIMLIYFSILALMLRSVL
jgi:4-hydroxybenzoate polyprenyltransferase